MLYVQPVLFSHPHNRTQQMLSDALSLAVSSLDGILQMYISKLCDLVFSLKFIALQVCETGSVKKLVNKIESVTR